ncbi:MAG: hypothetical protein AB1763_09330 [Campylobacterota bacterium]
MKTPHELRLMLQESYELSIQARREAAEHRRYYEGDQLPPDVLAVLQSRSQPIQWENTYKEIGNKILGYKATARKQLKVGGRQRNDADIARLLTDICLSIPDSTEYDSHKKLCDEDLMITGQGVMEITLNVLEGRDLEGRAEKEILGYHVPFEESFTDPYAKAPDYSDARYFHRPRWMDREDLYQYFDAALVDRLTANYNYTNAWNLNEYRQKAGMKDPGRDRVLVTVSWVREWDKEKREMKIRWYIWSGDTILSHGDSPYSFKRIPFVVRRLYYKDGVLRGLFHDIKPIQDSINFKLLRIANLLGSVKILYESDAVDDPDAFADEYSKDDAVVGVRPGAISGGKIKEIKHGAEIQYLMQQIVDARRRAKEIAGLNDEAMGAAVNRLSGYAIEQRQNVGMIGLAQYLDASMDGEKDFYKMAISIAQDFFDAEQVLRIVEPNEKDRLVTINEIERDEYTAAVRNSDGSMKRKNILQTGRYDITLTMVPRNQGAIAERYKQNVELMKEVRALDPTGRIGLEFLPELLADVDAPSAEKMRELVAKHLEGMGDSPQAQMQEQTVQLQMQQMQAKIKELESKAMINAAKTQNILGQYGNAVEQGDEMGQAVQGEVVA